MTSELEFPVFEPGSVWLVGSGPGDPGLLTLHALHALKNADVIVHDALVDPRILAMAPDEVELIYAGKRGHRPSPKQIAISTRLIELAREGRRVLRLKGGDPFVFGRGAEEADALVDAGIPYRLVPGITAGIGGLGYAGIPATARSKNSAVAFVTGHDHTGNVPGSFDWESLAKGAPVIIVYMPMSQLPHIVEKLRAAGRSGDEPVALVSKATTPDQTVLTTTLDACLADAEAAGVKPPSLFVVGRVVDLHDKLQWQDPTS